VKHFNRILALGAMALMYVSASSATTIVATCGSFNTAGVSGQWICPTVASLLPGGSILQTEYIVYSSDYSSGLASTVTEQTLYGFTGIGTGSLAWANDNDQASGGSSSGGQTSVTQGAPFNNLISGPPVILAGFYDNVSGVSGTTGLNVTVGYTNSFIAGSALNTSGYAQEVITFTTPGGTPEPGTLFLMGSALVGVGLIRRRRKS